MVEELLAPVRAAIVAAVRGVPSGQRRAVTEAVVTSLHEALTDAWAAASARRKPRYHSWHEVGSSLAGEYLPTEIPGYKAIRTEDGQVVIFSGSAKQLVEKLAAVPAGAHVAITFLAAPQSKPKQFDVRVR